ncbi:MAG: hypothetical protein PHC41_05505 [Lachnospiraceae bacterium]|nr:hypothetical protein [Lachnospiraceae bacterium]MDD3615666.1 hypothetical protein [Lachnospiraceae bacterium]
MSEEDFRNLFIKYVEEQILDSDAAERLLQRIMKILRIENPDDG